MTDKNHHNRYQNFFLNCWPFLAYFLISVILLFPLLRQEGIPFKYDWSWPIFDLRDFWQQLLSPNSSGLLAVFGKYPTGILGLIPVLPSFGVKIFLIAVHTFAGYGFYLFISKRVDNKLIAFVVGLAYSFSPYIFIRTAVGFAYSLIAYACLPFFANFYFGSEKKGIWQYLFLAMLFSFIASQIQAGVLLALLLLVNVFIPLNLHQIFSKIGKLLIIVAFTVAINLPWIFLAIFQKATSITNSAGQATTLNFIASLPHSFRNIFMLSDHHITTYFFYPLAHDKFFLAGWLVVWFVAFCAIFNKKNRGLILTFIISCLIVLPFVKGPAGIFGQFYIWFYSHFPQIAVFRETYHFEFLYAVSLCVLFAFGLDWIWQKISGLRSKNYVGEIIKTGLKALFAASTLFIIAPYLTFDYAGYFKLQKIPNEYLELNNFIKENKNYCKKIYYPPGTGFIYFQGDKSEAALNSDVLASSLGIPYLTDGTSVLNLPSKEMFYRNELVSQFYQTGKDNGEFANLLAEGGIDCVVIRQDIESKYFEASNLWREKDSNIYKKWMNPDMLALVKNKQGLILDKQFGENIYIYKISNFQFPISNQIPNSNIQKEIPNQANQAIFLPITDWANNYAYYKDGWSRGRYDFWRKHLFTQLRQDFLYTNKQGSRITAKVDQRGSYEVWTRLLIGGTAGELEVKIQDTRYKVQKDAGEERFVWKKLGDVDITDGKIEISNISGENAIADLVLIKK